MKKMILVNKRLSSVDLLLLAMFLSLISLLHITALALDTTTTSALSLRDSIAAAAATNETDFHALLALKSKILPDHQGTLSSWNESLHYCKWQGVQCSRRHRGRVTVIDLSSQGLVGSLSPHIGNLSFLRELWLNKNTFTGEIPTQLGNLFRLQKLLLSNNSFEGTIPESLSRASKLVYLYVGGNKLVGEFPKQLAYSMPELERLEIAVNNLTGGIPPFVTNFTSLEGFSASYNPFGGSIPDTLGQLKNLWFLGLTGTQITGIIPPSIYNLSLLTVFGVSENQLHGNLPPSFGFMFPRLQTLQLNRNKFTGPLPISIANSSQLVLLDMANNNFSGKITNDFGHLKNLKWIIIRNNNFGNEGSDDLAFLSSLTNCSNLRKLAMELNQFRGVLPYSIGNLSRNLFSLTLGGNQIYGTIPPTIGNLVNLTTMGMEYNNFKGAIPDSIGYLHKLQGLAFANNKLSAKIPVSIGNLSLLNELYLQDNRLEGAMPSSLGNCKKLLLLNLSGNNLSGRIPRQIFTITSLSISLDLARNHLAGSLPIEVGNLRNLGELDVSENGLYGEIPSTLASCNSLVNLYLQQNFFQGFIPPSLVSLRGIQNLDLSHNNLSGQIPTFLGTFQLTNLNLSFNNFEGELPMKGVFTNASSVSVARNHRLCGGISELQLPRCTTKKSKNKMPLSQTLAITAALVLVGVTLLSFSIICWFEKKRKAQPKVSLSRELFPRVTYGKLLKATNGFSSTNLLGFGSFGSVYRGILDRHGEFVVAVKVFNLQTRSASKSFIAECEVLRNIRHRNLIKIITSCSGVDFQGNEFKALVYEFMPNGSLEKWLHPSLDANTNGQNEFHGLNLLQRINIATDVACALDYLHHQCQMPIIHCDLKPSNILLDQDMTAHVGDFGLARFRSELTTTNPTSSTAIRGTIGYAAPEYGLGSEISTKGDVYSYGILLLEIITGKKPTDTRFEGELNLHNFAKMALPQRVMEIVDPVLLADEENGRKIVECLISLVKIGLACSTESPQDRMSLSDVLHELHQVQIKFLKGGMDR